MLIVICHNSYGRKSQMTDILNLSLNTEVSVSVYIRLKGHGYDCVIYKIQQMCTSIYVSKLLHMIPLILLTSNRTLNVDYCLLVVRPTINDLSRINKQKRGRKKKKNLLVIYVRFSLICRASLD